jgi:site-specific DNA-methyltransferase (adenine-specific)
VDVFGLPGTHLGLNNFMKLLQGDCLDHMKSIEDCSVDLILTDLPFGTTSCQWDSIIPFEKLWESYRRVIKNSGAIVLFASQPFTTKLISSNYEMFKFCLVWEKSKPTGFINAKNAPLKKHEDICVFSLGKTANKNNNRMNYYPQGLVPSGKFKKSKNDSNDILGTRPSRNNSGYIQEFSNYPTSVLKFDSEVKTIHPTQKPVALLEYLIKTYSLEGQTVLDGCMGSGSTGIACLNLKRNFIGIEKDEDYFKAASDRLESHSKNAIITP